MKIDPGTPQISPPDGDRLLHLLFFLTYTADGRALLKSNSPYHEKTVSEDEAKQNLWKALRASFSAVSDDAIMRVIDMHLAADEFAAASANNAPTAQQEAIYSQKLLAVLGSLYDDAMGHEFSLNW
ncbi:MAG TPA: hypothetical protein VFK02_25360 [Kofleriaceae bacterium]|nr:hypothetical protein [Kofleriaceae bacterium]